MVWLTDASASSSLIAPIPFLDRGLIGGLHLIEFQIIAFHDVPQQLPLKTKIPDLAVKSDAAKGDFKIAGINEVIATGRAAILECFG